MRDYFLTNPNENDGFHRSLLRRLEPKPFLYPLVIDIMSYPVSPSPLTVTASSLLATIAELEHRLAVARQQLACELQHPQGQGHSNYSPLPTGSGGRASIQLQGSASHVYGNRSSPSTMNRRPYRPNASFAPSTSRPLSASARPFVPSSASSASSSSAHSAHSAPRPKKPFDVISVPLSSVLYPEEVVTFRILLGKNDAQLNTVFDGTELRVTESVHVPSMVGMSSVKPGEILYRFMEGLKESGALKRSFTVAPWRLCSVVREGKEETLEELRRKFLQNREVTVPDTNETHIVDAQQVEESL